MHVMSQLTLLKPTNFLFSELQKQIVILKSHFSFIFEVTHFSFIFKVIDKLLIIFLDQSKFHQCKVKNKYNIWFTKAELTKGGRSIARFILMMDPASIYAVGYLDKKKKTFKTSKKNLTQLQLSYRTHWKHLRSYTIFLFSWQNSYRKTNAIICNRWVVTWSFSFLKF